jgi:hypothetical protein
MNVALRASAERKSLLTMAVYGVWRLVVPRGMALGSAETETSRRDSKKREIV